MASPLEIREGIASVLRGVPGLTVVTVQPETVPATLPAVIVTPAFASFSEIQAGRGQDVWEWDLLVLTSGADSGVGQSELDEMLTADGPRSIRAAIRATPDLRLGPRTTAWVDRLEDYGPRSSGGEYTRLMGATLRLIVRTSG